MTDRSKFTSFSKDFRNLDLDDKPTRHSSVGRKEIRDEETSDSRIRQNFPVEVENGLNKQINLEFQAAYTLRSMGIYFNRYDVALPGFTKFFIDSADHELKHAMKIMEYINKRGGKVVLDDIAKPPADDWGTGKSAMLTALDMLKSLNEALLVLHELTVKYLDPHADRFVKKYLDEHLDCIKKLGDYATNLERVGPGLGVYIFGQKTLKAEDIDSDSSDSDSDD